MRKRNLSKADQRDLRPVGDQAGDKFARVRPHAAESVSRHQYAHRTPGYRRLGEPSGLPALQFRVEGGVEGRIFLGFLQRPVSLLPIQHVILSDAGTSRSEVLANAAASMLIYPKGNNDS